MSEEVCKIAAKALSLKFQGSIESYPYYTPGCTSVGELVFFNTIVDQTAVYHERLLQSGGICYDKGKILLVYDISSNKINRILPIVKPIGEFYFVL